MNRTCDHSSHINVDPVQTGTNHSLSPIYSYVCAFFFVLACSKWNRYPIGGSTSATKPNKYLLHNMIEYSDKWFCCTCPITKQITNCTLHRENCLITNKPDQRFANKIIICTINLEMYLCTRWTVRK